jgi:hypothetical protein
MLSPLSDIARARFQDMGISRMDLGSKASTTPLKRGARPLLALPFPLERHRFLLQALLQGYANGCDVALAITSCHK